MPTAETTITTNLTLEVNIATKSKAFAAQNMPNILQITWS
jgi:hypothetical protein